MIFLNVSFYVNTWLCPSTELSSHIFLSAALVYICSVIIYILPSTSAKEKYHSSTYILDQAVKSIVSA